MLFRSSLLLCCVLHRAGSSQKSCMLWPSGGLCEARFTKLIHRPRLPRRQGAASRSSVGLASRCFSRRQSCVAPPAVSWRLLSGAGARLGMDHLCESLVTKICPISIALANVANVTKGLKILKGIQAAQRAGDDVINVEDGAHVGIATAALASSGLWFPLLWRHRHGRRLARTVCLL